MWRTGCASALLGGVVLNFVRGDEDGSLVGPDRKLDWQSILWSLPEAVFFLDPQGRIVDLNPAAEQISRRTRRELLASGDLFFRPVANHEAGRANERIVTRVVGGELVRKERCLFERGENVQPLEVLLSGSPLRDSSGTLIGALMLIQDITEINELQRQLASSERHFAVGQMAGGLAHDFNNVLNTISQAVRVLEMEPERTARDHQMFDIVDNAVRRGSEVIANIRGYLQGRQEPRSRIDMGRLLEEVLDLTGPLIAIHDDVEVERLMDNGCEVYANAPELRRAFTNLILNAVDAMPEGGTLTVRCSRSGGNIVAGVKDTGIGIAPEAQKMIFSPYFTTKAKGTGLGLVGARRTIKAQGGDIGFDSVPGSGTTFYVTLPVAKREINGSQAA